MRVFRILAFAAMAYVGATVGASAQSSAAIQVQNGFLSTTGCPSTNLTPCWQPGTKSGAYTFISGQYNLSVVSATNLTVPAGAVIAEICADQAIRYRSDGVAPTTTVGMGVATSCFPFAGPLSALQIISQTGAGVINVEYFK